MEKEVYLANPCKASSLPFWKTNLINIPDNMTIVLEEDRTGIDARGYVDERYFRLIHHMNDIKKPLLDNRYELVSCDKADNPTNPRDLYLACDEKINIL